MTDRDSADTATEGDRGDERLTPLVERIAELERERGRLEAELAEQRRRTEAAEARAVGLERQGWNLAGERDEARRLGAAAEQAGEDLRQRADTLQERHDALRSAAVFREPPAAPAGTSEAERRGTITGTADAPGPLRRLWRAISGGQP